MKYFAGPLTLDGFWEPRPVTTESKVLGVIVLILAVAAVIWIIRQSRNKAGKP